VVLACGKYGNKPEIIARLFREVLDSTVLDGKDGIDFKYSECFDEIIFPITSKSGKGGHTHSTFNTILTTTPVKSV
jgi:hypothetical protein